MISYNEFLKIIIQRTKDIPQITNEGKIIIEKSLKELQPLPQIFNSKEDTQFTDEEIYVWRYLTEDSYLTLYQDKLQNNNSKDQSIYNSFIVLQMTTMVYVHEHKKEVQALFDPNKRKVLLQSVTPAYLKSIKLETEKFMSFLKSDTPSVNDLLKFIGFNNIVALYNKLPKANIKTHYPSQFISPVDKVSNVTFNYAEVKNLVLYKGNAVNVLVGKQGSKKEIATMVSINFDEIEKEGVKIYGIKELTMYDREVHDAIATLCVEGGNEYITPQMIYQVMTGNPKIRLTPEQAEAISNSITKMMHSHISIDASKEAQAFGFDSFIYNGNLIAAETVTATLNGNVVECVHLLRTPPLYDYANRKGQIGRADIRLLNSPLSKTEETSVLQGYLLRRILTIKNPHNKQSNSILYETIYKQLEISAPNDNALKKKKIDIRKKVKTILDYWIKVKFIKGYEETNKGRLIYSIIINT